MQATPAGTGWTWLGHRWSRFGRTALILLAVHAALTAVLRLRGALDALLFVPDAPIDLLIRADEVRRWFAGIAIYGDAHSANYPPGTYALLWPLVGWLPEGPMRALFALSMAVSVGTIAWIGVRASHARGRAAMAFVALLVLPLGATQITVWIGQLGLHVVACLMGAAALLFGTRTTAPAPGREGWATDLAASALLAASLVKPTLSVPVVAAILILTRRWRPWVLTGVLYLAISQVAAAALDRSLVVLIIEWLGREEIMQLELGSVNTHLWLHWLGVEGSLLAASLLWLVALAVWTWHNRRADPWIVLAIAALVGRLWIHHRAFDDVLLVIPMIALFRIAAVSGTRSRVGVIAAGLFLLIYGLGHAPYAWLSGEWPARWLATEAGRTAAWLAVLAFLVWFARRVSPRVTDAAHA